MKLSTAALVGVILSIALVLAGALVITFTALGVVGFVLEGLVLEGVLRLAIRVGLPRIGRARSRRKPAGEAAQGALPSSSTRPLPGRRLAASTRSKVVLPAPEAPIRATRSPGATRRSTPASARWPLAWVKPTPSSVKLIV